MSQWCDLFFKPGASAILAGLREPATEAVLGQFGDWVLEELRGENIGNDLDGGAAQDKAEELGILVRVPVTEPCGERCECAEYGDFPQMCLRRALKDKGASQGALHDKPLLRAHVGLAPEPSGDFVMVPREPTDAMQERCANIAKSLGYAITLLEVEHDWDKCLQYLIAVRDKNDAAASGPKEVG